MAETMQAQQLAEPVEILEGSPQDLLENPARTMPENPAREDLGDLPQAPQKSSKGRGILLPLLTVLLILVGIGEVVFWGYFGFSTYARSLARERAEQQQKAEEQGSRGLGGSSYSPNLKVENGTVPWEREKWWYSGSGQPANTAAGPRREDGMRLSRLPVARIPYTLAEMDGELPSPEAGEA